MRRRPTCLKCAADRLKRAGWRFGTNGLALGFGIQLSILMDWKHSSTSASHSILHLQQKEVHQIYYITPHYSCFVCSAVSLILSLRKWIHLLSAFFFCKYSAVRLNFFQSARWTTYLNVAQTQDESINMKRTNIKIRKS